MLVLVKLGRQTGHFSFAENFSLLFSFSLGRPKTKMPNKFFVIFDGRKISDYAFRKITNFFILSILNKTHNIKTTK
jgi:hypothetical protein